jgi:hypothetical protein
MGRLTMRAAVWIFAALTAGACASAPKPLPESTAVVSPPDRLPPDPVVQPRRKELPEYSRLVQFPSLLIPTIIEEFIASEPFETERARVLAQLREEVQAGTRSEPEFCALVPGDSDGFVLREDAQGEGMCLLLFTTAVRAADYAQVQDPFGGHYRYYVASASTMADLAQELAEDGSADSYAINWCPRCEIALAMTSSDDSDEADCLAEIWCIDEASRRVRVDVSLEFASFMAEDHDLEGARDVLLEALGHTTLEDPRLHYFLGVIAIGLGDAQLLDETRAFLRFFEWNGWLDRLDQVALSGSPTYEVPEEQP